MDDNQTVDPQSPNTGSGNNKPFEWQLQLPLALPPPEPPAQPVVPEAPPQSTVTEKKVWGGWATIGFTAVILIVFFAAQLVVQIIFIFLQPGVIANPAVLNALASNGLLLSLSEFVGAPAGLVMVILFVKVRKGFSVTEYLGLKRTGLRTAFIMVGMAVGLLVISAVVGNYLAPAGGNNDSAITEYKTVWPPLLFLAVTVFAPFFEESLFRGFMFAGLKNTRLGPAGAVIITAALFGVLHLTQYDVYGVTQIFIFGIVLGIIRLKTKSLWNTIAVHASWNFLTIVYTALIVYGVVH